MEKIMIKKSKYQKLQVLLLAITLISTIYAGEAFSEDKKLRINTPNYLRTVSAGNTKIFRFYGMPKGKPGQIRLRLKWHVDNLQPMFNKLKVEVRHGENRVIRTKSCYSYHSNKNPKCVINITISQTEANRYNNNQTVDLWDLKVTNYSGFKVVGFDLEKGRDVNPGVPGFVSVYRMAAATCFSVRKNIKLKYGPMNIPNGATRTREISGIGKFHGRLSFTAKWHAVHPLYPYVRLRIKVIRPNGQTVMSKKYYSVHAPNTYKPKFLNRELTLSTSDITAPGKWKIRVINTSGYDVAGFDLRKGSDFNPLISNFNSHYQVICSNN